MSPGQISPDRWKSSTEPLTSGSARPRRPVSQQDPEPLETMSSNDEILSLDLGGGGGLLLRLAAHIRAGKPGIRPPLNCEPES